MLKLLALRCWIKVEFQMPLENKPWFRFYPAEVPKTMGYPAVPLYEILKKTAEEHPEKIAITYFENEINYSELHSLSDRFAAALAAFGVSKGDRVALFLPNIPQFVIAYYGILKAGAALTAISPLHKEREVEYQLNDSEAETILTLDSLYPIVRNVWAKTKLKRAIITSQAEYASKTAPSEAENMREANVYHFRQLIEQSKAKVPPRIDINPMKDIAALQYTGGTTG